MMGAGRTFHVTEIGKYTPKPTKVQSIGPGETGYLIASIKTLADVRVGDTITLDHSPAEEALPGYEPPRQMVFCDFYPASSAEGGTQFEELREAMTRLALNDASFTYEPVHSDALGFGFRCGFLGLLHMDIIQERLEREGGVEIVQTAPTVTYDVLETNKKGRQRVHRDPQPRRPPRPLQHQAIREPIVRLEIIVPTEYIGDIMKLCVDRRGTYKSQNHSSPRPARCSTTRSRWPRSSTTSTTS